MQAMGEFRSMFPSMDPELIESVLRANHGAVDETIDQLLSMTVDTKPKNTEHKVRILHVCNTHHHINTHHVIATSYICMISSASTVFHNQINSIRSPSSIS